MQIDIRELVAELREDHRNTEVLLGLVRQEVQTARNGGDPDFELLDDILHYLTVYADAVHHPREDRLYTQLAAVDNTPGLSFVETDHREIAAQGALLKRDCEAVRSGAALIREKFIADALRYTDRLEEHMRWEERALFSRAEQLANQHIDLSSLEADDPVFGPSPSADFETLLVRVRESVAN